MQRKRTNGKRRMWTLDAAALGHLAAMKEDLGPLETAERIGISKSALYRALTPGAGLQRATVELCVRTIAQYLNERQAIATAPTAAAVDQGDEQQPATADPRQQLIPYEAPPPEVTAIPADIERAERIERRRAEIRHDRDSRELRQAWRDAFFWFLETSAHRNHDAATKCAAEQADRFLVLMAARLDIWERLQRVLDELDPPPEGAGGDNVTPIRRGDR